MAVPLRFPSPGRPEGLGLGPWPPLAGSAALREVLTLTTSQGLRLCKRRGEPSLAGSGASEGCWAAARNVSPRSRFPAAGDSSKAGCVCRVTTPSCWVLLPRSCPSCRTHTWQRAIPHGAPAGGRPVWLALPEATPKVCPAVLTGDPAPALHTVFPEPVQWPWEAPWPRQRILVLVVVCGRDGFTPSVIPSFLPDTRAWGASKPISLSASFSTLSCA